MAGTARRSVACHLRRLNGSFPAHGCGLEYERTQPPTAPSQQSYFGVTPSKPGDDFLASFSATGPTVEGFVKPELVAPGGHLMGLMEKADTLAREHPEFHFYD